MATTKRSKGPASPRRPVRKQPETLRLRSASPSFTVNDLAASVAFYRDILGFVLEEEWDGGVSLKAGAVTVSFNQDDFAKGRDRQKGLGMRLHYETVQDLDALAGAIQARGGTLDSEPRTQPWGRRVFTVTDPDGFKISFTD